MTKLPPSFPPEQGQISRSKLASGPGLALALHSTSVRTEATQSDAPISESPWALLGDERGCALLFFGLRIATFELDAHEASVLDVAVG